jgi:hypothetical protein
MRDIDRRRLARRRVSGERTGSFSYDRFSVRLAMPMQKTHDAV